MNKNKLFFWLLLIVVTPAAGQDYAARLIPDSLITGANAVVRHSSRKVYVKSTSSLRLVVHHAVTILNSNGEHNGEFGLFYDKQITPSDISIKLYDGSGALIQKVKSSDISDYAMYDGMSIYTDSRVKHYKPVIRNYPYTLEYTYQTNHKGYTALPEWMPVDSYDLSVEQATFEVEFDTTAGIRYQAARVERPVYATNSKAERTLQWEIFQFKALEAEVNSPPLHFIMPSVMLACAAFEYDGSKGDLSDWNLFGQWIASLLVGRQELPATTVEKVKSLTGHLTNDRQKATVLYAYLQERMRYVSIQLGIGGFQPFAATDVDQWNYGDCKALTNYYLALLKVAGIDGIYTVTVSSDEMPRFYEKFPVNKYFNHVIAGVPLNGDTAWVECTSQYFPFGFISSEVAGKPALMVTRDGGKIITLPTIPAAHNNEIKLTDVRLLADGSASIDLRQRFTGLQITSGIQKVFLSRESQEKEFYENTKIPDITIKKLQYAYEKENRPFVEMEASVVSQRLATASGNRLFVPLILPLSTVSVPPAAKKRVQEIVIEASFCDTDSLTFYIPEGYEIESKPTDTHTETAFGSYHLTLSASENKLLVVRNYTVSPNIFPPEKYEAFRKFLSTVNKAEKQKFILRRK